MIVTNFSLKNHIAVYALIVIIAVFGLISYSSLPREANPDITIPVVIVTTTYPGVSPSDIETLVTMELEKELKNLENIKEMRSSSKEGVSIITVEFEANANIDEAIQKTRDKVNIAKRHLPTDADEPIVDEVNFSNIPIMIVNISGKYSLVRLKKVAENLKDLIETTPGVLSVEMAGGLDREVQVDVDPERLRYYGLAIKDVVKVIEKENTTIPGGSIEVGTYKYLVRIPGEFEDPLKIRDIVVKTSNLKPIYLRDIATVKFGFKKVSTYARLKGVKTISLSVTKRSGENIIAVTDAIKALVDRELPSMPRTTDIKITADQSELTRTLINELENNIASGLILVLVVLFFVLGLKVAIFVALSIPFSMLISFSILHALGFSLNMVVLFALILALGMLVDNAIVIVENIYRHAEEGKTPFNAAMEATAEVAKPVVVSTITTLCAFFPMIFWPGIMGEFFVYLPYTLSITLSASLFVALVINPTLCATLMSVSYRRKAISEMDDSEVGRVMLWYKKCLKMALSHRVITIGTSLIALIAIFPLYGLLGQGIEFFPKIEPSKVFIDIEAPTGTNIMASNKLALEMEKVVEKMNDVKVYVTNVGVSTGKFDFTGAGGEGPSHKSRIAVDFIDRKDRIRSTYIPEGIFRDKAKKVVGADVQIKAEKAGPPTGAPVNVEISGHNYMMLGQISMEVEQKLRSISGLIDLRNDYSPGRPELKIEIDRERAGRYGLRTRDVAKAIRTAIHGSKASTYRQGKDEYDIRVRFREDRRDRIEKLKEFFIRHKNKIVPLTSIATITTSSGYSDIAHIDQKKVVTVSAGVAPGLNDNELLAKSRDVLEGEINLPSGYSVDFTGQNEEQQESREFLKKAFRAAIFLILFVLILQFNAITTPLIIISSVILSFIGVLIGLMVTLTPFGIIMTGIGVISLAGVVVNNSIVLLDYTIQLRERGMPKAKAIVIAGMTRLRPVLLTAITTILGLLPMDIGISFDFKAFEWITSSDSSDWWGPMAVAVIFGLAFATALTLVVAPTLYSLFDSLVLKLTGSSFNNGGHSSMEKTM